MMQAEAAAHGPALEAHWGGGAAPFGASWQKTMMWIFIVTDGLLFSGLLCGYGFAWVGHFGFEKNKPASFKRPLYSFMGDWVMYRDIWSGKIRL